MLWFIYSTIVYYLAALNLENVSKSILESFDRVAN